MELEFSSFSIFLISLLFVLLVLNIRKRSSQYNGRSKNLPPGPKKLPIIGNLHQLVGSLPHHQFRHLAKKYGPLMHLQLGELSTVVVSSTEFAEEVMKTHDVIFASRPYNLMANIMFYNATDIGFSPYGEYWRQLRKICVMELLSTKRVQSFRATREEEVCNLVNWISSRAGSPMNFTDKIYSLTHKIVSRTAFGKICCYQETVQSILDEMVKLSGGFYLADLFPSIEGLLQWISGIKSQLERIHKEADQILENIVNEHIKNKELGNNEEKNEDLVDVLLKVLENGDADFTLTMDNIKAVIWDIFVGGTETSGTTMNWAMSELMKNPRIMQKAQAEVREIFNKIGKVDETGINEMKFLKLVIKETLRLHPPLPLLIPRECGETCEVKGVNIPVKSKVIINAWAIGRDSECWNEPDSFIPERFIDSSIDYKGNNFEYIPFGAGRRICPGMSFGIANVELPLAMLLYHFNWKHPNGMKHEDLDMTEAFGMAVRKRDDLCIIPIPYRPPFIA